MGEMINNTSNFLELINQTIKENEKYFLSLDKIKRDNIQLLNIQILNDLHIPYKDRGVNLSEMFKVHIKEYILNREDDFSIDTKILSDISNQIEIDFLLGKISKDDAQFYCSISDAITYYGLYRGDNILSFQDVEFWKGLIKKLYILNLTDVNQHSTRCNETYYSHPGFNKLPRLVEAKKDIDEKLKEDIDIIDSVVVFKKGQEERIVKKIEKKLSKQNLFNSLRFVFNLYQENKSKHKIEVTIPYRYIINILIKNIANSNHKFNNKNKSVSTIYLLNSFISLYQLKEDKYESMNISDRCLVGLLKKQVLYSNFYPLYSLKNNTLIEYIEFIIKPSINEKLFFNEFGFSIRDLINFFKLLDVQVDDVIVFKKGNIFFNELKILELFSISAELINENYATMSGLKDNLNIFTMNPIVMYKKDFYVIGFKYFKMNFYNALVEKIKKKIDFNINKKIGFNIDVFVEKMFQQTKDKHKYEIFSGNYKPPKKENPESDLLLKSKNEIILIENKNKYLTNLSFSGSDSNILKDIVLSFAFSQKQLFKHERNLKNHKKIKFKKDQRELIYENQNIVKVSVSTNNWYGIMNNAPMQLLLSLINVRFNIEEDEFYENKGEFIKANKYLDELQEIISELERNEDINMRVVLHQTLFLPLELIVDKYEDDNFIECLKSLVGMKMNTDNILNIYDYAQYLKSHKTSSSKST